MSVCMCKQCGVKKANRPGTLCHWCFQATGEERQAGSRVPAQLAAIRKAAKVPRGGTHSDAQVDLYVRLKECDIKAFTRQWDRLEREYKAREDRKNSEGAPSETATHVEPDGYDPSSDTVTPMVLGMIDRWLAARRAEVDEKAKRAE